MANLEYQEGDSFQGSPIELNRWVTPIWSAGGRVEFEGDTATIVYLPSEVKPLVVEEKVSAPKVEPPVQEVKRMGRPKKVSNQEKEVH